MLETVLYVKSMERTRQFYQEIFDLNPILSTPTITVFPMDEARSHVLLLFQLGATTQPQVNESNPENRIPPHGPTEQTLNTLMGSKGTDGGSLRQHFCFAVDSVEDVKAWEKWLVAKGVSVTGRMDWGKTRGYSVYFDDPEGNVGEVATGRLWEVL